MENDPESSNTPPKHAPFVVAILALSGAAAAFVILRFAKGVSLPVRLLLVGFDILVLTLAGYVILRKNNSR